MEIISSKQWGMIIKYPLVRLTLSKVDAIALHHMAHRTAGIKVVEGWHLNQGWRAFGYNYWVGFDGKIYEGRGLNMGAGVEDENDHIISIGFQGDYHTAPVSMSNAQFNAGIDMIDWVCNKVPTVKSIGGHKDYYATVCPGKYFPLIEMQMRKKREAVMSFAESIAFWVNRGVISSAEVWYGGEQDSQDCEWLCRKTAAYSQQGDLQTIPVYASAIDYWQEKGIITSPEIWYAGVQDAVDGEWLCRKTAQFEADRGR